MERWFVSGESEREEDVCWCVGGFVVVSESDETVFMPVVGKVWPWLFWSLALVVVVVIVVGKNEEVEDTRTILAVGGGWVG